MIPVIFVHQGDHDYLQVAMEQARLRNEVVLLHGPPGLWGVTYEHLSTNPMPFELFCFQRWFAILDWMKDESIEAVFYCDSDVMLYCNITELLSDWPCQVSFQIPQLQWDYRYGASAHCSYWTYEALESFCKFITETYEGDKADLHKKWEWHRETGTPGGVCDMTLLYLWPREGFAFANNAQVIGGATFDHNINVAENYWPDEYVMGDGIKALYFFEDWADKRPIGLLDEGPGAGLASPRVFFNALHFQGWPAKHLMEGYKG